MKLPILMMMISVVFALRAFYEARSLSIEQENFKNMAAKVDTAVEAKIQPHFSTISGTVSRPTADTPVVLPQYVELAQQNPEFYGWIKIDNTNVI